MEIASADIRTTVLAPSYPAPPQAIFREENTMSDDRTWGVLASQSDEDALRNHITGTADEFHADVAAREIHWQHPSCGAWLARENGNDWVGWDSVVKPLA